MQFVKGVGEKSALRLNKLGIFTAEDLLCYYPRDYVDYSEIYPLASAPYDIKCVVKAVVFGKTGAVRVRGGKSMYKASAGDETAALTLTWFNNPYALAALEIDSQYLFYGKIGGNLAVREMISPAVLSCKKASISPFVPVYPLTQGLTSAYIAKCVKNAFAIMPDIAETLPDEIIARYKLCSRIEALHKIHCPQNTDDIKAARRRLIFDELLCLQLGMLNLRKRGRALTGAAMHDAPLDDFWAAMPFKPTSAQVRSANELRLDLIQQTPMNRLLQGDVGSGKTVVAAAGIYLAHKNGYQSVLMVPTEILARQHTATLSQLLAPFGIKVALLSGSVKGANRKAVLAQISSGEINLVIGTHAVIEGKVNFARLGFAITDEQHRFGVRQRSLLASKADNPHLLVMSATPIPRTLGLLLFGELDISILDELPPGRRKIKTYSVTGKKRRDMYGFLLEHIALGEQCYIVCPLIDDNESELAAVTQYYENTAKPLLKGARVGLMHGRLKADDKAKVMQSFADGELDVLVSTTVIEVGVDVKNATIMVIENAERYGLSALHQLRGRVGRNSKDAYCILISDNTNESVQKRLSFLCHNQDGFEVAKYDLETRGPGDFFGDRQHGLPQLKIADLAKDSRILYAAQKEAVDINNHDPELSNHTELKKAVDALFKERFTGN